MSCPLIGRIAVVSNPAMTAHKLTAVRVQHRNHDVLLIEPPILLWSAILDILKLVSADDLPLLVWGVECTCNTAALRVA